MPINAMIPLSFQPTPVGPDLGKAYSDAQRAWQIEGQRQTLGQINALKDIFSQPGAIGPDGQPTREALQKTLAAAPEIGLQMQQNMLANQQRALQAQVLQSKLFGEKQQAYVNAQGAAWNAYQDVFARTGDDSAAQKAAQTVLTQEMQPYVQGGMYSPQEIAALPPFDKVHAHAVSVTPTQEEREKLGEEHLKVQEDIATLRAERSKYTNATAYVPLKGGDPVTLQQDKDSQEWVTADPEHRPVDIQQYKKFTREDYVPPGELYSPDVIKSLVGRFIGPPGGAGDPSVLQEMRLSGFGGPAKAKNAAAFEEELDKQLKERNAPPSEVLMAHARAGVLKKELSTLAQQEGTLSRVYTELTQGGPSGGGFAKQVTDTSDAVPRGGWKSLNKLGEAIQLEGGGENIVKFRDALQGFQNAYASIFSRGGGPTSVYAMEHADQVLQAAFSKGQIRAGIDQLLKEVEIAKEAPGISMEDAMEVAAGRKSAAPSSPTATPSASLPGIKGNEKDKFDKLAPGTPFNPLGDDGKPLLDPDGKPVVLYK